MKISQIVETTTSGSVASVAMPIGGTQKRSGSMFKGKKTKKKFYEGEMKRIATDMDELSDAQFTKKYGKTKEEMRKGLREEEIIETDLILMPGQIKGKDKSFIAHDKDRRDHEVEMARSDLYAAAKDAMRVYKMIQNRSEDEGLMGWQQSYITLAADYLNSVADSLEHDAKVAEMTGGVIAGGMSNFEEGTVHLSGTSVSESDSKSKVTYYAELKDVGFVKITARDANDAYKKAAQLWYPDEHEEIISNNLFRKKGLAVYMHNPGGEEYFIKKQKTKESKEHKCPKCGGPSYSDESIAEAKDACYNKVKSRYKVWPSAYASGALVKCRKVGAANWGNKSKK
jgi:hypothetical protein